MAFPHDLSHGCRIVARTKGTAAVAVLSLALGIGANTAIFSLINTTFLRPLAYTKPDRLAMVWSYPIDRPEQRHPASLSSYYAVRDGNHSFETVGAVNNGPGAVRNLGAERDGTPPEQLKGLTLSPSMFDVFGVSPLQGRAFTKAEDQVDQVAPVVLLSYHLWQNRFGGDRSIVGRTITLDGTPTTVIGVMPADFRFFEAPVDFVAPLEATHSLEQSKQGFNFVIGRLKPGVSIKQAQAEMNTIAAQLAAIDPDRNRGNGALVQALQDAAYGSFRSPLLILQGAVAFVLLIACANVAGLLLARATSRRTEMAIRAALGAGRRRIVCQVLTETIPLSALGGVLGVFLAWGGLRLFVASAFPAFPRLHEISVDTQTLCFTALVVFATSLTIAMVPALQASKADIANSLAEFGRGGTSGVARQHLRGSIVTVQIALALVLMVGAGLMINSFVRLQRTDLGVDPRNLLTFEFGFPQAETVKPSGAYRGLAISSVNPVTGITFEGMLDRIRRVPGVVSAAATSRPPLNGVGVSMRFLIEGRPASPVGNSSNPREPDQIANYFAISPNYFSTMKTRLLEGRDFTLGDTAAPVLIINQTMAHRFFPSEDPVGKRITLDWVPDEKPREIVGVVADTFLTRLQRDKVPVMYVPFAQQAPRWPASNWFDRARMYFVLRTSVDPMSLVPVVKSEAAKVDRNRPAVNFKTVEQTLDQQVQYQYLRFYVLLLGAFGGVALALAVIGLYSVMSYSVSQRTRELGIRIALGADGKKVVGMVLGQAMILVALGLALGLTGAFALTRVIATFLYGVSSTDVITYIGVSASLTIGALIASLIPARRAISVDPTVALRYE
jgi:putative ABC transport system permease protein